MTKVPLGDHQRVAVGRLRTACGQGCAPRRAVLDDDRLAPALESSWPNARRDVGHAPAAAVTMIVIGGAICRVCAALAPYSNGSRINAPNHCLIADTPLPDQFGRCPQPEPLCRPPRLDGEKLRRLRGERSSGYSGALHDMTTAACKRVTDAALSLSTIAGGVFAARRISPRLNRG